jgi:F-type H+-transporting ATPase subunit a
LSIRLFANMMAGHSLLKILAGFLWTSLENFTYWSVWSWVPLMVVLVVTVLEIMIAFLQSFVYLILVSIYINDVVKLH